MGFRSPPNDSYHTKVFRIHIAQLNLSLLTYRCGVHVILAATVVVVIVEIHLPPPIGKGIWILDLHASLSINWFMFSLKPILVTHRYLELISHSLTLFPQHKIVGLVARTVFVVLVGFPLSDPHWKTTVIFELWIPPPVRFNRFRFPSKWFLLHPKDFEPIPHSVAFSPRYIFVLFLLFMAVTVFVVIAEFPLLGPPGKTAAIFELWISPP